MTEIIAEIGQNHNGDMACACEMIWAAKENGADIAKFQVYDARKLFPRENNPWYDYNCKTELSRENIEELAETAQKAGIEFMASVFDAERVAWLEDVGVKRYKIASRSVFDQQLLQALVHTGKPLILSLGMWQQQQFPILETHASVDYLYCIAQYPAPLSAVKLGSVDFQKHAGFSDHTIGIAAAAVAFARGARIVEKHFTLDTSMYGPDHSCSMTPADLKQLHAFRRDLEQML